MKMMLAGSWRWYWYEPACAEALTMLGVEVVPFRFDPFFTGRSLLRRGQAAIPFPGAALLRLNAALIEAVVQQEPDWLWIWRGTHVLPWTLRIMQERTGTKVISYNNDDPFGPRVHGKVPWHHRFLWFWYIRALKQYDINFVYRPVNVREVIAAGGRNVHILKPYFIPWLHYPVDLNEEDRQRFECDVVFVGHYEPDGREVYIRALVRAGLRTRLFGSYWGKQVLQDLGEDYGQVRTVYGDEYLKALCGSKMCLGLLSRLNRDAYTRRCFEIPACGRLLLCERTKDLMEMFKDGEEAVFFSSSEELVDRARWLVARPSEIERIRWAGMKRVYSDQHDVTSRMREFLASVSEFTKNGSD